MEGIDRFAVRDVVLIEENHQSSHQLFVPSLIGETQVKNETKVRFSSGELTMVESHQ